MTTLFDIFVDHTGSEYGPVPAVDPADLKSVWVQTDSQAFPLGEQFAIPVDLYERACTPGADIRAVLVRVSILRMLRFMSESGGLISPWLHHGKPDDAVFKVVATFPVVKVQSEVRRRRLPINVGELIEQIWKEAKQRTRPL